MHLLNNCWDHGAIKDILSFFFFLQEMNTLIDTYSVSGDVWLPTVSFRFPIVNACTCFGANAGSSGKGSPLVTL